MKIKKNLTHWLKVAVIGIALGFALQFVRAWTEPTMDPPGGNVGAPINTSDNAQAKGTGNAPIVSKPGSIVANDFCLPGGTVCLSTVGGTPAPAPAPPAPAPPAPGPAPTPTYASCTVSLSPDNYTKYLIGGVPASGYIALTFRSGASPGTFLHSSVINVSQAKGFYTMESFAMCYDSASFQCNNGSWSMISSSDVYMQCMY